MELPRPASPLIINADDFGLTEGVNRAIAELHDAGAISSTTLMANSNAFEHAVAIAKARPTLAVGCHIVLTGGLPVANPADVPSLLRSEGRFRRTLKDLLADAVRGRVVESEVEIEAVAQIRRIQQAGITVSHIDTHKHTHLIPRIARPLMRAAAACGVRAIRNPFEPPWSARLSRFRWLRSADRIVFPVLRRPFDRLCREYGIQTNDGCIGISSTSVLNEVTLQSALNSLSKGLFELICHPGHNDADLSATGTRLRASREVERATLLKIVPHAVTSGRIKLVSFNEVE